MIKSITILVWMKDLLNQRLSAWYMSSKVFEPGWYHCVIPGFYITGKKNTCLVGISTIPAILCAVKFSEPFVHHQIGTQQAT